MAKRKTRKKTTRKKKDWIQGAIQHEGAFRKWCMLHGYKKVTKSCIQEAIRIAKKTGNTTLLRRANLAATLLKLQKKKAKKKRR